MTFNLPDKLESMTISTTRALIFLCLITIISCQSIDNISDQNQSRLSYSMDRYGYVIWLDLVSTRHQLYQFILCTPYHYSNSRCFNPFKLRNGDGPYFRLYNIKKLFFGNEDNNIYSLYSVGKQTINHYEKKYNISQHQKYPFRYYNLDIEKLNDINNEKHKIALMIKMLVDIDNHYTIQFLGYTMEHAIENAVNIDSDFTKLTLPHQLSLLSSQLIHMSVGDSADGTGSFIGQEIGGALFDPSYENISKTDHSEGLKIVLKKLANWINDLPNDHLPKKPTYKPGENSIIIKYCNGQKAKHCYTLDGKRMYEGLSIP